LWARAVTEILAPAHLVIVLPLAIGWRATWPELAGVWWGLAASLFCGVVPYAVILAGVRAGRLTDRHIVRRDQRIGPLALALASVVAGLAALLLFRATPAVVVLLLGMLGALVVIVPITTFWKISLHTAVAAGAATALTVTFGPYAALVGWPLVLLVAAARVALRVHTVAQVVAGALVGALVPLGVYLLAG
jgi:membrane-associated phospholipid phosphatase